MTESRRWLDGGAPPEITRLLRAGRRERPNRSVVQRTLLAVGTTGMASAATASALGAGGKVATQGLIGLVAKWTVVGVVGASGIVGATAGIEQYRATAAADRLATVNVQRRKDTATIRPVATAAAIGTSDKSSQPPPAATLEVPRGRSRLSVAASTAPNPPVTTSPDRALAEEIRLVDQARASLRLGDAGGTLKRVSDYLNRFPAGRFEPEVLYLKMEALRTLGNLNAASTTAEDIVARFPLSPQVGRAKALLRQMRGAEISDQDQPPRG